MASGAAGRNKPKIPAGMTKPKVAIIYSESEDTSLESKYFAQWIGAALGSTGRSISYSYISIGNLHK